MTNIHPLDADGRLIEGLQNRLEFLLGTLKKELSIVMWTSLNAWTDDCKMTLIFNICPVNLWKPIWQMTFLRKCIVVFLIVIFHILAPLFQSLFWRHGTSTTEPPENAVGGGANFKALVREFSGKNKELSSSGAWDWMWRVGDEFGMSSSFRYSI